ncbi:MAG: ubiquinone biosynthesis regulatory protein kinase UbiB [Gammaproteobacteria bacterium]|jgi:ubiquinone biosynthesis protein|nr:ubiquinone biosynthesis regulatory protein kinase UbiB [Gammaproteobacteria bacterium]MDH3908945.1 ubiquinone biosynthesis regulatory protein kinase UbiB [Gammaproteobacteria bacterium]
MASRRTIFRMLAIQRVLVKYGLDDVIKETHLFRPLRFLFYLAPRRRDSSAPLGERIRLALEELGPIFVKFGQAISTRRDLLPPDIADELAKLQDAVPPFPAEQAIEIINGAYGEPVEAVFERFDAEPLAAASIAQVHTAKLKAGTEVIVKVLRPGVLEQIERDLDVLRTLAGLADRYWEHGKRLRPLEVVDEYEHTILDELDLMREAANTAQLKRNFQGSDMLYVPEIYWDYCRPEVMVQERIYGTPISDMKALREAGANIQLLAENGVEIFFTQVFRHNFFHADMHPGNIFVILTDPERPKYAAVDFGIVGTLSPEDQRYLAENFLAFFDRNYHRIAKLHIDSGWVPAGTRVDQLETAVRTVCEPIFNKPLAEISFAQVLMRLFRVAQRFDVEVQPQMILLHKTLFNIEGLGRQLYPELDLWKTAHPVLRQWMDEQVGGRAILKDVRENLPQLREALRELPTILSHVGEQVAEGRIRFNLQSPELREINKQLNGQRRQRYWLTAAATSAVTGALVMTLGPEPVIGWVLLGAAALFAYIARP